MGVRKREEGGDFPTPQAVRGPLLWAEIHEGETLIFIFREEEASEDKPEGTGTPGHSKVW